MRATATCKIHFPDKKHLKIIFKALEVEVKTPATMHSKTKLEIIDTSLVLQVEAKDSVALRATLNAYLRWINSMLGVLEVVAGQ